MLYLAIDPGAKRTGLATGDDVTGHCGPVGVIHAVTSEELLLGIKEAIDEYEPGELVVGVPYNMDGSMSEGARKSEALAILLEGATGLKVHRVDERLTSYAADEMMSRSGLTHKQKKERRDALAAAAILTDFLDTLR